MNTKNKPKIAYMMSRFPHLPETFILREMIEIEKLGWEVELYPLICQDQPVLHEDAHSWLEKAQCSPYISLKIILSNISVFLHKPFVYLWLLFQVFRHNLPSSNFLLRSLILFPKSIHLSRKMQADKIQHIHCHYATHPALVAWVIHQITEISYSFTAHAHDIYVDTTMLETKLKDAAFIITISDFNLGYLTQLAGHWVSEKIHVVHCGIIPDLYNPASRNIKEPLEIINVGSLQTYKGQKYLIMACAILRDQGIPIHCRIVGMGNEKSTLEKLIVECNLESTVELLGPKNQTEVANLLPTANCFVQPSIIDRDGKMEGIPVALMEAMACSLPVIATDISGISELVSPSKTGYLVPPANPQAIANAIADVFNNWEDAKEIACQGRKIVYEEFDLSYNAGKLASIFEIFLSDSESLL